MRHKEAPFNPTLEQREAVDAHNQKVDKFNQNLRDLRSTPAGSALYDRLKSSEEMTRFAFTESTAPRDQTAQGELITLNPDLGFSTLAHEGYHRHQTITRNEIYERTGSLNSDRSQIDLFPGISQTGDALLPGGVFETEATRFQNITVAHFLVINGVGQETAIRLLLDIT